MDIVDDGSVNHVGVYVKGDSINITLTNNTINTASAYMMGAFFKHFPHSYAKSIDMKGDCVALFDPPKRPFGRPFWGHPPPHSYPHSGVYGIYATRPLHTHTHTPDGLTGDR